MEGNTNFVFIDWTLLFQWGNLLILYLIVKHFLFSPIQKMIAQRQNEVKAIYDHAEKAQQDKEMKELKGELSQIKDILAQLAASGIKLPDVQHTNNNNNNNKK